MTRTIARCAVRTTGIAGVRSCETASADKESSQPPHDERTNREREHQQPCQPQQPEKNPTLDVEARRHGPRQEGEEDAQCERPVPRGHQHQVAGLYSLIPVGGPNSAFGAKLSRKRRTSAARTA